MHPKQTCRWGAIISVQAPIRLDDRTEPGPDIALVQKRRGGYLDRHPEPDDVFLIVEVGDTSSRLDRTLKRAVYARAGSAEVWFVDLETKEVLVCRSLAPRRTCDPQRRPDRRAARAPYSQSPTPRDTGVARALRETVFTLPANSRRDIGSAVP